MIALVVVVNGAVNRPSAPEGASFRSGMVVIAVVGDLDGTFPDFHGALGIRAGL
jgi:hypothetical protein